MIDALLKETWHISAPNNDKKSLFMLKAELSSYLKFTLDDAILHVLSCGNQDEAFHPAYFLPSWWQFTFLYCEGWYLSGWHPYLISFSAYQSRKWMHYKIGTLSLHHLVFISLGRIGRKPELPLSQNDNGFLSKYIDSLPFVSHELSRNVRCCPDYLRTYRFPIM